MKPAGRSSQHTSFSDIFPYVAIANDIIISENPAKVTAILELHISTFDDVETMRETHDRLMKLLCDLPSDASASLYYCKLFLAPDPVLISASAKDIVRYMEKNKIAAVTARPSPEFTCYMSITLPVEKDDTADFSMIRRIAGRKGKAELFAELDRYKEAQERLEFFIKGLVSSIDGAIFRLSSTHILKFLAKIINHEHIEYANDFAGIFKSDWNTTISGFFDPTPGYVHYGDAYHTVLSLRACGKASRLPPKSHAGLNAIFTHKDIWDIPFIIQHTIHFPEKGEGLKRAKRRENMIASREGFAKYFKFLEKTPEGLPPEKLRRIVAEAIEQVENSADRFLEQHFHVYLWDKTLPALEKKYKTFDATISSTYKLKREKYNIKGAYYSIFPGNEHAETITTTLASFNVGDFMPIDLPRRPFFSKKNQWEIYYHTEMDSFAKIDLFDARCDNHNAVVAGGSGSGKSFTEQDKLWQVMKYDPCVAILDFGGEGQGSYLSFVKNLKGTYLEVNLHSDFSLNPFDGAYYIRKEKDGKGREIEVPDGNGEPSGMRDTALMATLERMAKGKKTEAIPDRVRFELNQCVKKYYRERNNNADNTCSLSDFAEKHLRENQVFINSDWDLYKSMYEFIGEGQNKGAYANFFRTTRDVVNKDIICFDMAGLKGHDRLKAVLVPSLINMIMTNILGAAAKLDRRKFIIMDEAWRELQGGDMSDFMVEMFRTIRKLNGQITIITQSLNDLLDSKMAKALVTNTSYFWLIGNKHDPSCLRELSASNKDGANRLSEYDVNRIINQQSKRDLYLLCPYYSGQLRLYPTREFAMLATTNPDEKKILREYMNKFGVDYITPEVIEAARNEF